MTNVTNDEYQEDRHNPGAILVDEIYLLNNLPDGWNYDCWWTNDETYTSHFTIYPPGEYAKSESDPTRKCFRMAFQSITNDEHGYYVPGKGYGR